MTNKEQEEKWKAESDANTLAEAEAIKADGARMKKAQAAAKRLEDEQRVKAEAMAKIAGAKMEYKKSPKPEK